jgi:secreted PhoX family phosphatase
VYFEGIVFFSTKGDNRIWSYDTETTTLAVFYDIATSATPFLSGVDNLTVTANGDVLVAEDAGDMEVVAILEDGTMKPLLQVTGQSSSELTGLAFDPSGTRLYVSSQRGIGTASGITYEISGPFHLPG